MKKIVSLLLLATTICHCVHAVTSSNPRNTLITAIARNDFGTTLKALEQITDMTFDEKQQYLQMADQIIASSIFWHAKHSFRPEIGKNLIKAAAYAITASIPASLLLAGVGYFEVEAYEGKVTLQAPATHLACLAALTGFLGYKAIQNLITAWEKPSNRLENALRIKDAIFHCEVTSPKLSYNCVGGYTTAVGGEALSWPEVSQCPDTSSYNIVGSWDPGVNIQEVYQNPDAAYNQAGHENHALGVAADEKQIPE